MQPESRLQLSHYPLIQTLYLYQMSLQPVPLSQSVVNPVSVVLPG